MVSVIHEGNGSRNICVLDARAILAQRIVQRHERDMPFACHDLAHTNFKGTVGPHKVLAGEV